MQDKPVRYKGRKAQRRVEVVKGVSKKNTPYTGLEAILQDGEKIVNSKNISQRKKGNDRKIIQPKVVYKYPLFLTKSMYTMVDFFATMSSSNEEYRLQRLRNLENETAERTWTVSHNTIMIEALKVYSFVRQFEFRRANIAAHLKLGANIAKIEDLTREEILNLGKTKSYLQTVINGIQEETSEFIEGIGENVGIDIGSYFENFTFDKFGMGYDEIMASLDAESSPQQ